MPNPTGLLDAGLPKTTPAPVTDQVAGYPPPTAAPVKATATGYTPVGFAVTPDQTVAGQIAKLIDQDSPLMRQAVLRARTEVNNRGLINSSLAVDAGQQAVIAQALPIATADAQTYDRAATNTVNQQNAALNFGAGATNTAENVNAQLGTNVNLATAGAYTTALSEEARAANSRSLALIDNNTKMQLSTLDVQNRQLLQTNANAANMYAQTVKNIADIATNTSLDATAKSNAIASQLNLLNEGLRTTAAVSSTDQAAVSNLDLSSYFANQGLIATTPSPAP